MKRKIFLSFLFVTLLVCVFAVSVNAVCSDEHSYKWQADFSEEGFFGDITLNGVCTATKCYTKTSETIDSIFYYLGYSYGDSGYVQSYAVNRESLARYEEISGDKVEFGGVATTESAIGTANPLDSNGNPISSKVKVADFTSTDFSIINISVKGIGDADKDLDIVCSLYVKARGQITYLDNAVEKTNRGASSYNDVKDGLPKETPTRNEITIIDGKRYTQLDMAFAKGAYWSSGSLAAGSSWDLTSKFCSAAIPLTKEELPVGSIILVDSENYWQYRIDKDSARGSYTKQAVFVIDEDWWGETKTASFTLSKHLSENASSSASVDLSSCTEEEIKNALKIFVPTNDEVVETSYTKQDWNDDGAFKVLLIGNSFSQDTCFYAYQAAKAMGIENVKVGNLYIGAGSISDHIYRYKHGATAELQTTADDGKWSKTNVTLETAVTSDDWDFIILQQVSPLSGEGLSFESANALIDIIEPMNPSARIAWNMTWAYQSTFDDGRFVRYDSNQEKMYQAIISATQSKIVTNDRFEVIVPTGTVIQNIRTSYIGDTLTRDGYHLNETIARQAAALSLVHTLTGISVDGVTTGNYSVLSDAEALVVVIEAINNATLNPFAVTESEYPSEDDVEIKDPTENEGTEGEGGDDSGNTGEGGGNTGNEGGSGDDNVGGGDDNVGGDDITGGDNNGDDTTGDDNEGTGTEIVGYKQLTCEEMELTRGQYYNSSNGSISKGTNVCYPGYYTVKKYNKETLPVGSKIFLAAGWQYRLIVKTASGSYTNTTVSTNEDTYIEITEEWWGDNQEVCLNISAKGHAYNKVPTTDLTAEEVATSKFIIYIPIISE